MKYILGSKTSAMACGFARPGRASSRPSWQCRAQSNGDQIYGLMDPLASLVPWLAQRLSMQVGLCRHLLANTWTVWEGRSQNEVVRAIVVYYVTAD